MKKSKKPRGYIRKIIQPDESIVHQANVHWIVYIWAIIHFTVGVPLLWYAFGHRQGQYSSGDWIMILALICGPLFTFIVAPVECIRAFIKRVTTELVITDLRVITKIGFIRRRTWEINRNAIEGVQVDQSILGRILGFGTISVMGRGRGIAPIEDVDDPITFRNHVPFD